MVVGTKPQCKFRSKVMPNMDAKIANINSDTGFSLSHYNSGVDGGSCEWTRHMGVVSVKLAGSTDKSVLSMIKSHFLLNFLVGRGTIAPAKSRQ